MAGYDLETNTVRVGARDYQVCSLINRQQFSDPGGVAERAGIFSAAWPMFGVLWPAGRVMAEYMADFPVAGKSILEMGCGLGLPSLVLQQRGADITASDHHPLADEFLRRNADLNGLPYIPFWTGSWADPALTLGRFDLIIASDVLYERDHPGLLAGFVAAHSNPESEVLLADPGRGHGGAVSRMLALQGYAHTDQRRRFDVLEKPPFRGRMSTYRRTSA